MQVLTDLCLSTILIYITGGIHTSFNFLYPLVIIVASILLPRWWAYLTAALSFRPSWLIAEAFCDEVLHGTGTGRPPTAVRLHCHLSLYFPAIDDGAGTAAGIPEDQGAANRR